MNDLNNDGEILRITDDNVMDNFNVVSIPGDNDLRKIITDVLEDYKIKKTLKKL